MLKHIVTTNNWYSKVPRVLSSSLFCNTLILFKNQKWKIGNYLNERAFVKIIKTYTHLFKKKF